jgi:hypothetical protein
MQFANQAAAKLNEDLVIQAKSALFLLKKAVVKKAYEILKHMINIIYIKIKAEASKACKLLGAILALKKATVTNPETGL